MSDSTRSPHVAAELIHALREEAAGAAEAGEFTIDAQAARAKMTAFQYPDRTAYLVPILEGLFMLGGVEAALVVEGSDLMLEVWGARLRDPAVSLREVFGGVSRRASDAEGLGLQRLGVGLDMALGHNRIQRVLVAHPVADGSVIAVFEHDAPPRLCRSKRAAETTRVVVDRGDARFGSVRDQIDRELALCERAATFSPLPVSIRGAPVSATPVLEFATSGRTGELRWTAGLSEIGADPGRIDVVSHGLAVETIPIDGTAFAARLEVGSPRYDLSQMRIVRDEDYEAALDAIRASRSGMYRALERAEVQWARDPQQRPPRWPADRVARVLHDAGLDPKAPPVPTRDPVMDTIRMFASAASALLWGRKRD